jgi:mercuric ion transport protein
MAIKEDNRVGRIRYEQSLMAMSSFLGAVAASSCCILPLALFSVGVSGAWIGNLTRLAPYQPYFITATIAPLGLGYWLLYRSSRACANGEACTRAVPNRLVKVGLVLATVLVVAALGFDLLAPLVLN